MPIDDLVTTPHPIFQAPMAGASNPTLVAAVSNAGGLGGLGAAPMKPDVLRQQVQQIRELTDKPFCINLFAPASEQFDAAATIAPGLLKLIEDYHAELDAGEVPEPRGIFGPAEEQLAVLIEEKVPLISFHFGVEAEHVNAIHDAGLKVLCSATTVDEARQLESVGVDAIIAQGSEAGGHRGTFLAHYRDSLIGTLALVPQVVDAVSIPVIAAGGIMDARGIVACRALGADAVQMGTAFLACPETGIANAWRETLLGAEAHHTTVTEAMSGKPARGIRNRYIADVEALNEPLLPYPLQYAISGRLRGKALQADNPEFMAMWSGQGVGMLKTCSAGELIEQLVTKAAELTATLSE